MFELSDFYGYCQKNQVDIIAYNGCPQPGATVRDRGNYAIFLDFTKIASTRLLRGVCYHELGHAATGALHKVDSPLRTGRAQRIPGKPVGRPALFDRSRISGSFLFWIYRALAACGIFRSPPTGD